jgi:membrane protease YdiL (CAAX protease family)
MGKEHSILSKKQWAIVIISLYILGIMVAESFFWNNYSVYYSYLFEVIIVVGAWFLIHPTVIWKKLEHNSFTTVTLSFFLGLIVFHLAKPMKLFVPFDFKSNETLVLLLVVAPILEEAIFRMALWDAFRQFTKNHFALIAITSFLFMAGHLSAYWFVSDEYKGFVLYQAAYVVLLGFLTGVSRLKTESLNSPVLTHFVFNFGFFLSAKFWM